MFVVTKAAAMADAKRAGYPEVTEKPGAVDRKGKGSRFHSNSEKKEALLAKAAEAEVMRQAEMDAVKAVAAAEAVIAVAEAKLRYLGTQDRATHLAAERKLHHISDALEEVPRVLMLRP